MKKLFLITIFLLGSITIFSQGTLKTNLTILKTVPTLHLKGSGGIINFNDNDVLITHSTNKLTISGGNLDLPTNGLQINGVNVLYGETDTINDKYAPKASPTFTGTVNIPSNGLLINSVNVLYGESDTLSKKYAAVADTMTYPGSGIALSTGTAWGTSITNNSVNWNTAYTDRFKWDGGATGLTPATGRTSLGGTTAGQAFFTLTNPSAITFPRINADNTVTALSAANYKTALGATTVGNAFFTLTNPSAIRVPLINADNTVTATETTGTGNIVLSASPTFSGTVALGSGSLTMTGSLAATGSRVLKGWFTDLEITNLPTINGGTFKSALSLTSSDVGLGNLTNKLQIEREDSTGLSPGNYMPRKSVTELVDNTIDALKAGATLAVAATDSNKYNGGYMTPKVGEIMSLAFKVDTTAGAPQAGDSIYTHGFLIGKNVEIFRGDAIGGLSLQFPQAWDGYEYDNTTGKITFHPEFSTGEKVIIRATDTLRWISLKAGQNLALYSEELNRTGGTPYSVSNSLTVVAGNAPDVTGRNTLDTLKMPVDLGNLYQVITVEENTEYIASWDMQEGTATSFRYKVRDYTHSTDIIPNTIYSELTNGSYPVRVSTPKFTTPSGCTQVTIFIAAQGSGGSYQGWALAGRVQLAKTGGYPYAKTTTTAVE